MSRHFRASQNSDATLEGGATRESVLILTGAELLTCERPPHCWNEELQNRFQSVHSLMEHCNASQQIYLGLPSWQEDWQATFERRRRAMKTRIGTRLPTCYW